MLTETITPLDVREGDILYVEGYRVEASDVWHGEKQGHTCAEYTLRSKPSASHPRPLPPGYEGMRSGGNHLARVGREVPDGTDWEELAYQAKKAGDYASAAEFYRKGAAAVTGGPSRDSTREWYRTRAAECDAKTGGASLTS